MTSFHPPVRDDHSPLQSLITSVLRRFGAFNPDVVQGDVALMFLEMANEIINDWNLHPYTEDLDVVPDYVDVNEAREIPDRVMFQGLLFLYLSQQGSERTGFEQDRYYQTLNEEAYKIYSGGKSVKIKMQPLR